MLSSQNKAECSLRGYAAREIPAVWSWVKPLVEKALDRGSNYTVEQIYDGLCCKEMQLWAYGTQAALVTTIQTKGGITFCLLLALGGRRMSDWFEYLPIVESWAKDEGAQEVRIYGRPGWIRLTGYDIEYCKLVKKL